jgi:hypothetical protein
LNISGCEALHKFQRLKILIRILFKYLFTINRWQGVIVH